MIGTVQIGPLALPLPMLLMFAAYGVGSWLGVRRAAGQRLTLSAPLLLPLILGLLAARLSFVVQFHDDYLAHPLDIIDIRDGGWNLVAGWSAAWACTLWRALREPLLRRYFLISLAAASAIWVIGTVLFSLNISARPSLPAISLLALNGQTISLESYTGKPTVVNLWATWCPPCQREMPVLHEAEMAHPEIRFVYLNQSESAEVVTRFLSREKLPLQHVLLDSLQLVAEQFKQRALPTTLFFDSHGKLADMRLGELSRATLTQHLHHLSPISKEKP